MQELLKKFIPNPPRIKAIECGSLNAEDSNYYLLHPITSELDEHLLVIEYLPAVESKDLKKEIQSICRQNIGVKILGIYKPLSHKISDIVFSEVTKEVNLIDFVLTSFSNHQYCIADYLLLKVRRSK